MPESLPIDDPRAALYTVGQVADMLGVQQAFLRRLDTLDVLCPSRSDGGQRRYSRDDISYAAAIRDLVGEGNTVAGASRILELEEKVRRLEAERDEARRVVRHLKSSRHAR